MWFFVSVGLVIMALYLTGHQYARAWFFGWRFGGRNRLLQLPLAARVPVTWRWAKRRFSTALVHSGADGSAAAAADDDVDDDAAALEATSNAGDILVEVASDVGLAGDTASVTETAALMISDSALNVAATLRQHPLDLSVTFNFFAFSIHRGVISEHNVVLSGCALAFGLAFIAIGDRMIMCDNMQTQTKRDHTKQEDTVVSFCN